jgi:hypothetical protein
MSRFSFIFIILIAASLLSCKGSATGPGNNPTTTPTSVGDSIPRRTSYYIFEKALLNQIDSVEQPTIIDNRFVPVDSTGLSFQGKNNVYFITGDENDSSYYFYENNGDVSVYFWSPGYTGNSSQSNLPNEYLTGVAGYVFRQWIRLPIASKDTGVIIYNANPIVIINTIQKNASIRAKIDFIGDSNITLKNNIILAAKHCRITIMASWDVVPLTHVRDLWFVPKIGYFAKIKVRTNVPDTPQARLDDIPVDTTATQKILTSYHLN